MAVLGQALSRAVNMSEMTCVHVCICVQEMKDQLSSPSAVAQAEKKNRQVGGQLKTHSVYTQI